MQIIIGGVSSALDFFVQTCGEKNARLRNPIAIKKKLVPKNHSRKESILNRKSRYGNSSPSPLQKKGRFLFALRRPLPTERGRIHQGNSFYVREIQDKTQSENIVDFFPFLLEGGGQQGDIALL